VRAHGAAAVSRRGRKICAPSARRRNDTITSSTRYSSTLQIYSLKGRSLPISTAGLALERAVSKRARLSRHAAARDSSGGRYASSNLLIVSVQTLAHGRDEVRYCPAQSPRSPSSAYNRRGWVNGGVRVMMARPPHSSALQCVPWHPPPFD